MDRMEEVAQTADKTGNERVACVVVTFNRLDSLLETLASVATQTRRPDEVHVVDNAGQPEVQASVVSLDLPIHYHPMPENLGYAAGLAVGMRASVVGHADFVWLLDDDSIPRQSVLEGCLDLARSDRRIGIVGLGGGSIRRGSPVHESPTPTPGGRPFHLCDFVLVDGALVTRLAIDEVGYPRADFFMMMEDIEYSRRLRRAGWDVVRMEGGSIQRQHLGSSHPSGFAPPWRGYYQTRNQLRMALEPPSLTELTGWLVRQAKFIVGAALFGDRRRKRIGLRLRGAWDGMRGVSGRTVEPG